MALSEPSPIRAPLRVQPLRHLVAQRRISYKALGAAVGCTGVWVSRCASGIAQPSKELIGKLAYALGVEPADLFDATVIAAAESVRREPPKRRDLFPGDATLRPVKAKAS